MERREGRREGGEGGEGSTGLIGRRSPNVMGSGRSGHRGHDVLGRGPEPVGVHHVACHHRTEGQLGRLRDESVDVGSSRRPVAVTMHRVDVGRTQVLEPAPQRPPGLDEDVGGQRDEGSHAVDRTPTSAPRSTRSPTRRTCSSAIATTRSPGSDPGRAGGCRGAGGSGRRPGRRSPRYVGSARHCDGSEPSSRRNARLKTS